MASDAMRQIAQQLRAQRKAAGGVQPDIGTRRRNMEAMAPPLPEDVEVTRARVGSVGAEWICAPGASPGVRLLYLHGGGYAMGSLRTHRRLAADISRAGGCSVLLLDYRLAPENPHPAAVEDGVAALRAIRTRGPHGAAETDRLVVAGDSAGGGLTVATLVATRDAGDPLPRAAVTISAWTDLAGTGDSLRTRADVDPTVGGENMGEIARAYLGEADPRTPLASPLYADLSGLPPLLLQVGDHEVLLDDTTRLAVRAGSAGVDVTLEVEPEAFHVWHYFAGLIPEGKAAIDRIGAFIREHAS